MAENFSDWFKGAIGKITGLPSAVADAVGGAGSVLKNLLDGFTNALVGIVGVILPGIVKIIPDGITAMTDHWKSKYKQGISIAADGLVDILVKAELIDQAGVDNLNALTKTFGVMQSPMILLCLIGVITSHMKNMGSAVGGKIMQEYQRAFSPYAIDASSAVRAAFIAPDQYKVAYDALRRNGLSDSDITLLFQSVYRLHDTDTVRDLFLRGEMQETEMKVELRKQGLTDKRIDEIVKTWQIIPGPQDIISMAVREAFDESQASSLGLDEAFPSQLAEWGAKVGLSPFWTKMYWRRHWELPSPQMGFEMLHRGIITEDDLSDLLKALDYSPRWHEALKGISYNVLTRVDLRRIFELGLITADEMEVKYKEQGYSPTDAAMLRKWTEIEYNQEYKDLTKNEVVKQYLEGIIDEPTMINLLEYMGFTRDRIDTMVALASYQRAYAKQSALVSALKKLYISGQYSLSNVQQELAPYNIDPRRVMELTDQWEIERLAGITLPKKTELDDWFEKGIITPSEYVTEMQRIGYSDKNIERYVRALTYKEEGK